MKIIIITGQTATGKTSFALQCAATNNGELINADSRQIYKHLDVITGKDLTDKNFKSVQKINNFEIGYYRLNEFQKSTKVWLYDIVNPDQYFSSFDFQKCAMYVIKDILCRGKTPIIVGGTYFYLKHLLYEIGTEKILPDWNLRKTLEKKTTDQLKEILKTYSNTLYESLNNSERNNPQRLIRKIEIAQQKPDIAISEDTFKIVLQQKLELDAPDDIEIEFTGLKFDTKEKLHALIESRVHQRIQEGAVEEVEHLLKRGYSAEDAGLKTIGCVQILKYLNKVYSKEDAIREWITKEKQYSKRQFTFMKKDTNIHWKTVDKPSGNT